MPCSSHRWNRFTSRRDDLENLVQQAYPQCLTTCAGATPPRTVTYDHDQGRLTAVSGWAEEITYHPNGLWATIGSTRRYRRSPASSCRHGSACN